jgi:hypothetical protein
VHDNSFEPPPVTGQTEWQWREYEDYTLPVTLHRYLARYVFRVAITNSRIVGLDDKDRKSKQWRTTRLSGHEFMRRFLQHVLPKGLHKVRYYGPWASGSARARPTSPSHAPARPSSNTVSSDTIRRDDRPRRRPVGRSHTSRRDADLPVL